MNAKELRKAADFCKAAYTAGSPLKNIAEYLESCADAMEAGPVATVAGNRRGWFYLDAQSKVKVGDRLYPLALPAIPQGWKLVPVEPTQEMVRIATAEYVQAQSRNLHPNVAWTRAFESMLAAAPTPPVAAQSLRLPEPMTDAEVEDICWTEMDRRLLSFARAIEAETLRRVKEANE